MKKRKIKFAGYEWIVKSRARLCGQGPNYFSGSKENVWLDKKGMLHLKITKKRGKWYCAEVYTKKSLGYGKYSFHVLTNPPKIDKNAVAGFFTYLDIEHEIDIEFARWNRFNSTNTQFTVQPWQREGSMKRFNIDMSIKETINCFEWTKNRIFFECCDKKGKPICKWLYRGKDNPKASKEKVRINLWLFHGRNPEKNRGQEIIIKKFEFLPA